MLENKTTNIESLIFNSAKARGVQHCWNSTYLINNELFKLFDFEKSSGYFSSDNKRYDYPYTYEEIVKIVDGNLKKYYDFKKEILKDKIDDL